MRTLSSALLLLILSLATAASAAEVSGSLTDRSGGVLPGATVRLLNVATEQQITMASDSAGRFLFRDLRPGVYRLSVNLTGFSDASRTIVVGAEADTVSADFELDLGSVRAEVTVAAARGERDTLVVPIRTDTVASEVLREVAPTGTGDALVTAPGVTLVGSGPFQTRPRLRGLDSTRVLVLVDGERLNNARTATDRAGIEVGLIDVNTIEDIEVLGGAGSVLYGTDALSGTINIVTNRPRFTDQRQVSVGFDGLYSSNENGRRGTVSLGASDRRWAISFKGGSERFDSYQAGKNFRESSQPYFDQGLIRQADTVDDAFGFHFKSFPDPFNAPFTRTSALIPNGGMSGTSANLSGLAMFTPSQTLEVKYQRRRAENVGFPDFAEPYFFQSISLPESEMSKFSATYAVTNVTNWLPRISITPYYQRQDRLLRNRLPVQFPAPSAAFFPINVYRLNILSDTRQQVWTPGVDVQATILTHPNNVVTAGMTAYRDRSEDERTTTTQMTKIGSVGLGAFGPAATVLSSPIDVGPPSVEHPVRVPNASFRDVGLFVQDEWDATSIVRFSAGLRMDRYQVATKATAGYTVDSLVAGASPAIDPSTLPNINGDRISRNAVTGEAGIVAWSASPVSVFAHYVRSYRHPNLEELLFSGPATTGNIVPNVRVEPETGHNVDTGLRVHASRFTGSLAYYNNTYRNFISTEIVSSVVSRSGPSPISQAINLARVRIQGVEAEGNVPFVAGSLNWLPYANVAYTRGTVLSGTIPSTGLSLAGEPQDNITPWKVSAGLRVNDRHEHWWGAYNVRSQGKVTRVSPLLSDSPFLIPQDLLGLAGFTLHRIAAGYDWRQGNQRVGFGVIVDNLTDAFYREQFQFAPARGRSVSFTVTVRGVQLP